LHNDDTEQLLDTIAPDRRNDPELRKNARIILITEVC
jgi:hypothetical protein